MYTHAWGKCLLAGIAAVVHDERNDLLHGAAYGVDAPVVVVRRHQQRPEA